MKLARGTVYSKALAIFLIASLLLLGAVAALTQLVIMRKFNQAENREMKATLQRFSLMLSMDLQRVDLALRKWSQLAVLEEYANRRLPGLPGDLGPENLKNLQIDFLAIYDKDGTQIGLVSVTAGIESELLGKGAILDAIGGDAPFQENARTGFALLGDKLASVSISPIVSPHSPKAPVGHLVAGKILGPDSFLGLETILSAEIHFHPFKNLQVNQRTGRETLELFNKSQVIIDVESSDRISGNSLVRGFDGQPLGYFSLTQNRPLREEGQRASSIFLVGVTVAGGVLVFLIWFLLDRTILARISDLMAQLEQEKRSGRLPVKLSFGGTDELGQLARSIEDLASMLQSSQSEFRAVAEDQSEMLCRFDNDLRLVFANQVFLKMFGLQDLPLADCALTEFLPDEMTDLFVAHFRRLTPDKPLVRIDREMTLPSGQTLSFHSTLRASFSDDGQCLGGQWVIADMSLQVLAQRRMLESEYRFQRLFETSSDGILLIEGETQRILDINTSLGAMLGLAAWEVGHLPLSSIPVFAPCLDAVRRARGRRAEETGRFAQKNELCLRRADGSLLYVELHCTRYFVADKDYMQLNFRNISDRVKGEHELRELSAKLLRLQDEERRRIARELHDSTAQNLSALEMNMSLLEPLMKAKNGKAGRLIEESREIARECSQEIRNISYLLHPPLIDEVGLTFALRWFAAGFAKRTSIETTIDVADDFPRLDREVEMPLFRVAQEALSNIYRHSGAAHAWISLTSREGRILLEVRDDGHGFLDESAASSSIPLDGDLSLGVGLAGMRERLAHLGGRLDVATSPQGVIVTASLILSQLEHAPSPH